MPNVLGSAVFELSTDDSKFTSGLQKAESEAKGSGSRIASAMGGIGTAVAVGLGGAVVGVGLGLGKAVSLAADFEHQIDAVGAVSNATASEIDQIGKTALRMGKETAFGTTEIAGAMEVLASNGISAADIINGAAQATVDLAAAGGTDLKLAADVAGTSMTVWGLKTEDMTNVVNRLAGAANVSRFGVEDLSGAIASGGGVAATYGVTFDDFTTSIAAIAPAYKSGEDAGTGFKAFLGGLIPTTKQQKTAMKELGIVTADGSNQFFDAAGNIKSQAEVTDILHNATKDMTAQQKAMTLELLFGTDGMRAAGIMTDFTAESYTNLSDKMRDTSAAEVAAQRMGNFKGSLEQLKGSLETIGIEVGLRFLPVLSRLASFAATVLPAVFDRLDGIVSGVLRSIGPAVQTLGQVIQGAFRMLTGQAGTGALQITRAFQRAFGPETARMLSDFVQGAVRILGESLDAIVDVGRALASGDIGAAFRRIGEAAQEIAPIVRDLALRLGRELLGAVRSTNWGEVATTILSGIGRALATAGTIAVDLGGRLLTTITNQVREINWGDVGRTVLTGIGNAINAITDFVVDIGGRIWGWVSDTVGRIQWGDIGTAILGGIAAAVAAVKAEDVDWSGGAEAVKAGLLTALKTTFSTAESLGDVVLAIVGGLTLAISETNWEGVGHAIGTKIGETLNASGIFEETGQGAADGVTTGFVTRMAEKAGDFLTAVQEAFSGLGVGIHNGIAEEMNGLSFGDVLVILKDKLRDIGLQAVGALTDAFLEALGNFWSQVLANIETNNAQVADQFSTAWATVRNLVADAINGVAETIGGLPDRVIGVLQGFVDSVVGFFQGLYEDLVGGSIVPDMVNEIIATIQRLPAEVPGIIGEMVTGAVNEAAKLASELATKGTEAVDGFASSIRNGAGTVAEAAGSLKSAVTNAFSGASDWLVSAGKNIVSGLVSGMDSLLGTVRQKAADIASAAAGAVTSALGIKSPSTVFAEIGRDIINGLMLGVDDKTPELVQKTAQAADAVIGSMSAILDFAEKVARLPETFQLPSRDITAALKFWAEHAVESLGDTAHYLSTELVESAKVAGDSVKSVFGGLSEAFTFAARLAENTPLNPSHELVANLKFFAEHAVRSLGDSAVYIGTDLIEAAKDISEGIRSTFGALGDALAFARDAAEVMQSGLSLEVPQALTDALVTLITNLTIAFDNAIQQLGGETLERARLFAESAGPVLDAVRPAIDVLQGIAEIVASNTVTTIPERFYQAITSLITRMVQVFQQAAEQLGSEALESARAFADAARPMFDLIEPAVKAFGALTEMGEVAESNMGTFQTNIQRVVSIFATLNSMSAQGLVDALGFQSNMEAAAAAAQAAAAAIGGTSTGGGGVQEFHAGGILPENIAGVGPSGQRYSLLKGEGITPTYAMPSGGGMGGGGQCVIVEVPLIIDGREFARATGKHILDFGGRQLMFQGVPG